MNGQRSQKPISTPRYKPAPLPTNNPWKSQSSQINDSHRTDPQIPGCSAQQQQSFQQLFPTPKPVTVRNNFQQRNVSIPQPHISNHVPERNNVQHANVAIQQVHNPTYPNIPPPMPHQQAVHNLDLEGIIKWAQSLMTALANTRPEQSLNVIISHVMPLMLVQSLVTPRNGQP
jgi:hypothetical protein